MKFKLGIISKIITLSILLFISTEISVEAHGVESVTKHADRLNKSGLGKEHFHEGYEAHLHQNGVCKFKEEEKKELAKKQGKEDGQENGYLGMEKKYLYNKEDAYFAIYEESYDNAFKEGSDKLAKEKDDVREYGYNIGYGGQSKLTGKYENKLVNEAYIGGHKDGFTKFKEEKSEDYGRDGALDGENNRERISLENLDEDYVNAYNNGYNSGREKYKDDIENKGFSDALNGLNNQSLYNEEEVQWYNAKHEDGVEKLKVLQDEAYAIGFEGKSKSIPEKFENLTSIFEENYEKGLAQRLKNEEKALKEKNENNIKIAIYIGSGVLIFTSVIFLLRRKSIKNKMNNELDDDRVA